MSQTVISLARVVPEASGGQRTGRSESCFANGSYATFAAAPPPRPPKTVLILTVRMLHPSTRYGSSRSKSEDRPENSDGLPGPLRCLK